jgi:quercetin 2,3-dioxygenase
VPSVVEVRRAGDRFRTERGGITTRHSFSFGAHYDPGNVGFALLLAHNDELLPPGTGYGEHPHADVEIVTWVLDGALRHEDTRGGGGVVTPGLVQRLSAGRGVRHIERHDPAAATGATRFVQMWLRPDREGLDPSYAQRDVSADLAGGGLVPVAGADAAVGVHAAGAVLWAARPAAGTSLTLPDAPHLHLFVARGAVDVEGAGALAEADAARFTAEGGRRVGATTDAELLVWAMP